MRYSQILALALAFGGVGMAVAPDASAQGIRAVREQAQASMVLTGWIDIGTEGEVEGFRLDKHDQVNAAITRFVEGEVRSWRFEPVMADGQKVKARTPVSIRLGGSTLADGGQQVRLMAASFEKYDQAATGYVTRLRMPPPAYPNDLYYSGARGDVLLLVQVGRDGKVMEVATEQVNLRVVASEANMRKLRDRLSRASQAAARRWTFNPPSTGDYKDDASWTVRVPVRFSVEGDQEGYGVWDLYISGPRQQAPWRRDKALSADANVDLLPTGGVFMADAASKGPTLLTPLDG